MGANQQNWGGKREGSGRKRTGISDKEVRELLKSAKAYKKQTGESIADQLMKIIYRKKPGVKHKEVIAAVKVFFDQTVTSASEADVQVSKVQEPAIYLPKQKQDPSTIKLVKAGNE
jgi:hypothetical protein